MSPPTAESPAFDDQGRPEPPHQGDERSVLEGFLDFQRATVVWKASGLSDELAARHLLPTSPLLTVLGVVRHLTAVERYWFSVVMAGADVHLLWDDHDYDAEFRLREGDTVASVTQAYQGECAASRLAVAGIALDAVAKPDNLDQSLRWVYAHMIEETARHVGHLDLLRESLDGAKGE